MTLLHYLLWVFSNDKQEFNIFRMTGLAGSLVVAILILTYCIYLVQDFFDILKYEIRANQKAARVATPANEKQEPAATSQKSAGTSTAVSSNSEQTEKRETRVKF